MGDKEHKDYWSPDGFIFFTGGYGYKVTPEGQTICAGKEEEIISKYYNPKKGSSSHEAHFSHS